MIAEPVRGPAVSVAIPAYNEAEGISEFLREIDVTLGPHASSLTLVVVDDASTDGTPTVLATLAGSLSAELDVLRNPSNRGHGPTLLRAYRRALEHRPDFVIAVDGDGQFRGLDLRRVLALLRDEAHGVGGVRRFRQDPWFRMIMTRLLRGYVRAFFGVRARDPNCPLRGYDAGYLERLLGSLPPQCLIPNLYLTILASRRGDALLEVDVSHSVRRAASAQGSTWGGSRPFPIPWRLVRFSLAALREAQSLRGQIVRTARVPDRTLG